MSRKSELESKIRDLESQIRDIKSRISDQEYKNESAANIGTTASKYVFMIKNYPKFLATTSKKANVSLRIIDVSFPVFIMNFISTKMNLVARILMKMMDIAMKAIHQMMIMMMTAMARKITMKMTILLLRPLKKLRK